MEYLFGLLILILNIIAIVDAIRGGLTIDKKILWIVLILLLPVLGMLLYFLLGKKSLPRQTV